MTDRQAKHLSLERLGAYDFKLLECTFEFYRVDVTGAHQHEHKVVWEESGQWFHTDETWSEKVGPFATEDDANAALHRYVLTLG